MHSAHDLLTRWPALDVAAKRARLQNVLQVSTGPVQQAWTARTDAAGRAMAGLWRRDVSVWGNGAAVQQSVANRLGWLDSPALMAEAIPRLESFASSICSAGFTDVVLLGMGGSSLAPEVLRAVLGVAPGWPRFQMLDSTDPAAVRAVQADPAHTLYILASKSGTTIEPNSLAAHFKGELERSVPRWNDHFIAITDGGTELEKRARHEQFRDVFINPSEIGGRYSAVSFFGLVPAALMGQDIKTFVGWALAMLAASEPGSGDVGANPAAALGLAMGAGSIAARDKLTLVLPAALEPFGLWVEQLVAESTGKAGRGVIPIAGEPLGTPTVYGSDRFFVHLRPQTSNAAATRDDLEDIRVSGMPFAELELPEPSALGAEFVRWEIATAVAGALLEINPFDEPSVQQAKDATRGLLDSYVASGRVPAKAADRTEPDGASLTLSTAAKTLLEGKSPDAFLTLLKDGDYFGLLAYVGPDPELAARLHALRVAVRDRTRAATMFGYGPRYLHSTGQLHKGGPNSGVFLVLTVAPREDLPIPGQPFSFGTLELAQGLGDFASLDKTGRRALHVHLPTPDHRLLDQIAGVLLERLPRRSA